MSRVSPLSYGVSGPAKPAEFVSPDFDCWRCMRPSRRRVPFCPSIQSPKQCTSSSTAAVSREATRVVLAKLDVSVDEKAAPSDAQKIESASPKVRLDALLRFRRHTRSRPGRGGSSRCHRCWGGRCSGPASYSVPTATCKFERRRTTDRRRSNAFDPMHQPTGVADVCAVCSNNNLICSLVIQRTIEA